MGQFGKEQVVIIGAGVGGLSAAIELAARGLPVTILEKEAGIGGKLREIAIGEHRLDGGPTVFTMRHVFDELFAAAGTSLEAEVSLERASTLARHFWSKDERLDLHADHSESAEAIRAFSGPDEAGRYLRFVDRIKDIHSTLDRTFLRASRPNPLSMVTRVGLSGIPSLFRLKPFSTLWRELGASFTDPRLRQLYGRYATYCGSSPFEAAATLMIVAHVEQAGVYLVKGGMARLAEAMQRIALRLGVTIRSGAKVIGIEASGGSVKGVRLAGGERIPAAAIICNADASALASGLFGLDVAHAARRTPPLKRSLSAMVTTMVAETKGFPLHHHTVFFSRDYKREFDEIFGSRKLPSEPTVYICAQDRGDTVGIRPGAQERLLTIVNAPADGDAHIYSAEEIEACDARMMAQLQRCGLTVSVRPQERRIMAPSDWNALFPATGGALYGRATHGPVASFLRPDARTAISGLYLAGGSAHPGPGVPMAALSGSLAARSLLSDRALMRRFVPAATFGGISTPSAMTASMASPSSGSSAASSRPIITGPAIARPKTMSP